MFRRNVRNNISCKLLFAVQSVIFYLVSYLSPCSYSLMVSCWAEFPEKRPSFSDLVDCLNKILEPMAQYMDFTQLFTAENDKNEL